MTDHGTQTPLRGHLHLIDDDLRDEPWIQEVIEGLEERLAAEAKMDEYA